jgi:hypothetical protein
MADVSVLVTNNSEDSTEAVAQIFHTHAEAQAALYQWCRDRWTEEQEDDGNWPHGPAPADNEEMYEKFREWATEYDFTWHLYRDVPLPT